MKKESVLIVDDEEINRIILAEILNSDYNVYEASNGAEALNMLYIEKKQPMAVLLDLNMPGVDGYTVLREIKSHPKTKLLPVLIISAADQSDDAATLSVNQSRSLREGASDFIPKPFNPDIVKARLDNHVALYQYQTQLERLIEEKTNELSNVYERTLEMVATFVEYRHVESGQHIKRTAILTELMIDHLVSSPKYEAFHSRLRPDLARSIIRATALHDIGKIGIDDRILLKPGKLTDEEFEEMQKHTVIGSAMVGKILETLGDGAEGVMHLELGRGICMYHHERWDGKGYPTGLKGEDIPLSARITSLVDVYDAIVNPRVYKEAFSHERAMDIIVGGRAAQFDPLLVDAFVEIADKFAEVENAMRD